MNVGVIGAGLIGTRRAKMAKTEGGTTLKVIVDIDQQKVVGLASELGCEASTSWQNVVEDRTIDIVVVSTPTSMLAEISLAAVQAGKHVLVEKPMGRSPQEIEPMVAVAQQKGVVLKTGFSLRYHPAIQEAYRIVSSGQLGKLMYGTAVYGHGGRLGYEKDWRCDPKSVSGGELLDQGIHLVDLYGWFLGEISEVSAFVSTALWPIQPLEDNGFGMVKTREGVIGSFHVSWSRWRNKFYFEIFGESGYVQVSGLGGSYGVETLVIGKRAPQFGAPTEEKKEYPPEDVSWAEEWKDFTGAIKNKRQPFATGQDGLQAMKVIEKLYESAKTGKSVAI